MTHEAAVHIRRGVERTAQNAAARRSGTLPPCRCSRARSDLHAATNQANKTVSDASSSYNHIRHVSTRTRNTQPGALACLFSSPPVAWQMCVRARRSAARSMQVRRARVSAGAPPQLGAAGGARVRLTRNALQQRMCCARRIQSMPTPTTKHMRHPHRQCARLPSSYNPLNTPRAAASRTATGCWAARPLRALPPWPTSQPRIAIPPQNTPASSARAACAAGCQAAAAREAPSRCCWLHAARHGVPAAAPAASPSPPLQPPVRLGCGSCPGPAATPPGSPCRGNSHRPHSPANDDARGRMHAGKQQRGQTQQAAVQPQQQRMQCACFAACRCSSSTRTGRHNACICCCCYCCWLLCRTLPLQMGQWLPPSWERNSVSPTIIAPAAAAVDAHMHQRLLHQFVRNTCSSCCLVSDRLLPLHLLLPLPPLHSSRSASAAPVPWHHAHSSSPVPWQQPHMERLVRFCGQQQQQHRRASTQHSAISKVASLLRPLWPLLAARAVLRQHAAASFARCRHLPRVHAPARLATQGPGAAPPCSRCLACGSGTAPPPDQRPGRPQRQSCCWAPARPPRAPGAPAGAARACGAQAAAAAGSAAAAGEQHGAAGAQQRTGAACACAGRGPGR